MADDGGGDVGGVGGVASTSRWLEKWQKNTGNWPEKHVGSRASAGQQLVMGMRFSEILRALLVEIKWGCNFVVNIVRYQVDYKVMTPLYFNQKGP